MTAMVSNKQQVLQPVNSAELVGIFKAIVPRSFEKTFEGMPTKAINHAMKLCIDGLTRDQINFGLSQVRDNGFCPDLAMFRKWCLGIVGFGTEQQRAVDSFKGKHAALANIVAWRVDKTKQITNAEREAYNRCYQMFQNLDYANSYERASFYAYEAFKDNYAEVVQEFVQQGVTQSIWDQAKALEDSKKARDSLVGDCGDWGGDEPERKPLSKEEMKEYLAKFKSLIRGVKQEDSRVGGGV